VFARQRTEDKDLGPQRHKGHKEKTTEKEARDRMSTWKLDIRILSFSIFNNQYSNIKTMKCKV